MTSSGSKPAVDNLHNSFDFASTADDKRKQRAMERRGHFRVETSNNMRFRSGITPAFEQKAFEMSMIKNKPAMSGLFTTTNAEFQKKRKMFGQTYFSRSLNSNDISGVRMSKYKDVENRIKRGRGANPRIAQSHVKINLN